MVHIEPAKIKSLAFDISKHHKTYDQLAWRFAELELYLQSGKQPENEKIRQLAEAISEQDIPKQKLHWFIAERILLIQKKWGIRHHP